MINALPKPLQKVLKVVLVLGIGWFTFQTAELVLYVIHPASVNPFIAASMAFLAIFFTGLWLFNFSGAKVHKQRPDVLSHPTVYAAAQAASERLANNKRVWAGDIEDESFYIGAEDRACVVGPPGTGKTVFLISQLYEWCKSGQPFIVLDVKPEIHNLVKDQLTRWGYTLRVFNPTGHTGQCYNPLDDIDSLEGIGELAAALIPTLDPKNAVFSDMARDLLDALINQLRDQGQADLKSIRAYLGKFPNHKALIQSLIQSNNANVRQIASGLRMVAESDRLLGSIFASFQSNLRFLNYVGDTLSRSDFSLKEFCQGQPVGLFLQAEEKHQLSIAQLTSALIGHFLRYFITHTDRPPVLLLLDEIGNVPPIVSLAQKLNTIRSRNLPTWMYWQSLAQMQAYGENPGQGQSLILGACDAQLFFRLNDNDSAQYLSDKIGRIDRVVEAMGLNLSHETPLPSFKVEQSLKEEPAIYPHELQQLKQHEIVVCYRGLSFRAQATPYHQKPWPLFSNINNQSTLEPVAATPLIPEENPLIEDTKT